MSVSAQKKDKCSMTLYTYVHAYMSHVLCHMHVHVTCMYMSHACTRHMHVHVTDDACTCVACSHFAIISNVLVHRERGVELSSLAQGRGFYRHGVQVECFIDDKKAYTLHVSYMQHSIESHTTCESHAACNIPCELHATLH